ncbi:MAG TPA: hypothetical protein VHX63_09315 [Acidobacteriaceae bacterium]|jgi:hypothetical protein|nr:hypothetical protein [Acidobacteriaceae bacterium]
MVAYESIAQMMQANAGKAIESAKDRFGFHLDYSEATLEPLETILTNVATSLPAEDKDKIEYETKLWGSYFGEVIRQRWEGTWELAQYPGTAFTVPAVNIRGAQLYPLMKVHRRLTMGDSENLWQYYQKIRQKLMHVLPTDGS